MISILSPPQSTDTENKMIYTESPTNPDDDALPIYGGVGDCKRGGRNDGGGQHLGSLCAAARLGRTLNFIRMAFGWSFRTFVSGIVATNRKDIADQ